VDGQLCAAGHEQAESGRRDHEIRLDVVARTQADARWREALDVPGDHRDSAVSNRLEEVAVGYEAQALVPRVVAGREVRLHVVPVTELLADALDDELLDLPRCATRQGVEARRDEDVLPACEEVGGTLGEE